MDLLSPDEVSRDYPALTERRQKRLRSCRALPFHRLGHRTVVYTRRDIEKFLASRRVEAFPRKVKN